MLPPVKLNNMCFGAAFVKTKNEHKDASKTIIISWSLCFQSSENIWILNTLTTAKLSRDYSTHDTK